MHVRHESRGEAREPGQVGQKAREVAGLAHRVKRREVCRHKLCHAGTLQKIRALSREGA